MSGRRRFGAVRKLSSGRWQARFRDPETNLYRNAPRTFATKTAAAKWLSAIETDIARDAWHDPKRGAVLFRQVAEQWYATKLHLRPSTQHIYRTMLDCHILPTFADVPVGSITTLDVQMWISDRHRNTRMGANSVAKAYKLLRTVMESALDAGLIVRNPCRVKGAGTERLPEMRCATVEEVAAIAQAVEPRWQALILLAAYSGLRWGELAGLRRRYLDPLHKTVRVVEQCTEVNGHFVWGPPKTSRRHAHGRAARVHLRRHGRAPRPLERTRRRGPGVRHARRHAATPRELPQARLAPGVPSDRRRRRPLPRPPPHQRDPRRGERRPAPSSHAPPRPRLGSRGLRYQHRVAGQDEAIADYLEAVGAGCVPGEQPQLIGPPFLAARSPSEQPGQHRNYAE